ncbi:MAG: hypothetical protein ACI3XJ_00315 [Oscillospiraceae bacterium]
MEKTANYQLNQWGAGDAIRRADFNADNARIDTALAAIRSEAAGEAAAAQATGDRGLGVLKKLAGDVCRLAYQQDGKGTYTGWREGIAFDGLNADHQVESTSGAAVLEPDNGQVRLAVDGWSGGTIEFAAQNFPLAYGETAELLTDEWSPAGKANLNTVQVKGYISNGSTTVVMVSAVLMDGETEIAATGSAGIGRNGGGANTATLTFSSGPQIEPGKQYRLRIVVYNGAVGYDQTVQLYADIPVTATAVRCTEGSFTTAQFPLAGQDITAWVQVDEGVPVTAELELPEGWTSMALEQTRASQTPEGTACQEWIFNSALPQALSEMRLRFSVESESECMIYGYGVMAV